MERSPKYGIFLVVGLLVFVFSGCSSTTSDPKNPPNFIVIFVDDMGYGDLAGYGHPTIQTPHLDRMATEGMKFTQFYVGASVCTPSRAALLTGRYPIRSGLTRVLIPSSTGGLPDEEVTLAEALKEVGYATGIVGKWHLGSKPEFLPLNHGFDYYFGIPYSNDMSPGTQPGNPLFENDPPTPLIRNFEVTNHEEPDQGLLTTQYTEEALNFITQHAGHGPFFLYLAHTMPHVPLGASDSFRGRSPRGLYGDVVEELDWSTGQILDKLREVGIEGNTLVLFTSDNGPWLAKKENGGSAGPFKEGKVSTFEGGYRVPALFWWPGRISAGVTTSAFATTMDIFTTCIQLAGASVPGDRVIDGKDLSSVLLEEQKGRRPELYYYFGDELWAYREGPFKIHLKTTHPASVQKWGEWPVEEHDPPILFDVEQDPSERFDRAASNPEIVDEMKKTMEAHRAEVQPGIPQR